MKKAHGGVRQCTATLCQMEGKIPPPRERRPEAGGALRRRSRLRVKPADAIDGCAARQPWNRTASCLLPLALQRNPLSLLELTSGSGLVWQRLQAATSGAYFLFKRVLVDHVCGTNFEGALGRPSNPGSRGLAAHHHHLRVPDHRWRAALLHDGPPLRGAGLRVRGSLRDGPCSWVLICPSPRPPHDGVRLAGHGRRHATPGRVPRERRSSGSAASGADPADERPPWAVRRSGRARTDAVPSRVCHELSVER